LFMLSDNPICSADSLAEPYMVFMWVVGQPQIIAVFIVYH
jgi:hypothetical protein